MTALVFSLLLSLSQPDTMISADSHFTAGVDAFRSQNWSTAISELSTSYATTPRPQTAYLLAYANAQTATPASDTDTLLWSERVLADAGHIDHAHVVDAASLLGWAATLFELAPQVSSGVALTTTIDEQQKSYRDAARRAKEWRDPNSEENKRISELLNALPNDVREAYESARLLSSVHCANTPHNTRCAEPPPPVHLLPDVAERVAESLLTPFQMLRAVKSILDPRRKSLTVPLSNVGIADARFLNPRNPLSVYAGPNVPLLGLEFVNRTVDRTFVVSMTITLPKPPGDQAAMNKRAQELTQFSGIAQCKPKDSNNMTCVASVTVQRSARIGATFSSALLTADLSGTLRTFQVRFFDETEIPSNPKGFIRTDPSYAPASDGKTLKFVAPPEPDNQTKVSPVASVAVNDEPALAGGQSLSAKAAVIDQAHVVTGARRTHFPGAARLDVSQNIGARANADLSFVFSSTDFGDQNDKGNVIADKYKLSVYALNRITLDFGKYVFATPASKLAISEKGQGATLTFPTDTANIAVSYVARRQGDVSVTPQDLRSAADVLLQVTSVNVDRLTFHAFRTMNLFALSGRDNKPADRHSFSTVGAELFFGSPLPHDASFGGSFAVFHSERTRSSDAGTGNLVTPHGHGTVALLRSTWNPEIEDRSSLIKPPDGTVRSSADVFIPWSLSAVIAAGTRARDRNDGVDTSYIGDRGAFAPDLIFLSSLVAPLSSPNAMPSNHVGAGMTNKLYYSVSYANNEFSLLDAFARAFGVQEIDVASRSTQLSVSRYRLLSSALGTRDLGTEYDLQFQIETPKSVKVGLNAGYFVRSRALHDIFKKNVWVVTANVSIAP